MRKFVGPFVYALLLLSFTVYIALDTFVIARVYAPEQASSTQSQTQSTGAESLSATDASTQDPEIQQGSGQVLITDNTYSDDHIHISITPYRESVSYTHLLSLFSACSQNRQLRAV